MFHPRNILIALGVLLMVGGGWWSWRANQPILSDEQQIAANLEELREAIASRNANRIAGYLADDFTWNGQTKRELSSLMKGAFLQWRDVQPNITGLQVSTDGQSATASGKFSLAFKPRPKSNPDAHLGEFKLSLEKREGQWLITKAEGGGKLGDG